MEKANNPQKALKYYYKSGEEHIEKMIDLVVRNKTQE
jgi:hypothetical protein